MVTSIEEGGGEEEPSSTLVVGQRDSSSSSATEMSCRSISARGLIAGGSEGKVRRRRSFFLALSTRLSQSTSLVFTKSIDRPASDRRRRRNAKPPSSRRSRGSRVPF